MCAMLGGTYCIPVVAVLKVCYIRFTVHTVIGCPLSGDLLVGSIILKSEEGWLYGDKF